MNAPEPLQQVERTCVLWRGRKLVYFSGCDYFRLASHPAVLKAAADGVKKFGLNVAASRLTTGHHRIYAELETALARFFKSPSAVLLPGGYSTSTVVAQALAGEFAFALIDERAHPALQDAAMHLGCAVVRFKHRDVSHLQNLANSSAQHAQFGGHVSDKAKRAARRLIVLTDGMFSHDGSAAPLKAYLEVLPRTAQLLVDDAHGAGVLGATGRGTLEHEGASRSRIIQCVTLSKAFGVYGGAVLGTRDLREEILTRSRAFIGCTPLPLPLANAALRAVKIHARGAALRARLGRNATQVKNTLRRAGVAIPDLPGPIVAIHPRSESAAHGLRKRLLAAGIYPPFVRYAGVEKGFFRFVISSEHTREQLERLCAVLVSL